MLKPTTKNKKEYNHLYYQTHKKKILERTNKYRKENPEIIKERKRKYYDENKERLNAKSRQYYADNKDRLREHKNKYNANKCRNYYNYAHTKIWNAVREGKIIPQPCEVCGKTTVQAHHDDYNKPYEVRWLCEECHKMWHRYNKPVYLKKGEK